MEHQEKELLCRMGAALVFAQKMFGQVHQYTSKHCEDCMMNRYRAGRALAYLETLLPEGEKILLDRATLDAVNAACREIEEESWEHREKECA